MTEIVTLDPHAPLPETHSVVVLRRFDEIAPRATVIEFVTRFADGREEASRAVRPDGGVMTWAEAAQAGRDRAAAEGLPRVLVIDRTQGPREQEILSHGGDHTFKGEALSDTDPEDGETGPDMRDRQPS